MKDMVSGSSLEVSDTSALRCLYADGALYDAESVHVGGDLEAWTRWAVGLQGPVLEMGCGTGRITSALAAAGVDVTGVDDAPAMLEAARRKLPKLRFIQADMRHVELSNRFRGVLFGLNALMHPLEGPESALRRAAALLDPGGQVACDVFCTGLDTEGRDDVDPQQLIAADGGRWIVTERRRFDPTNRVQVIQFIHRREGEERRFETRVRVPKPTELEAALRAAGFEIISDRASFREERPFRPGDPRRVLIARLPRPPAR